MHFPTGVPVSFPHSIPMRAKSRSRMVFRSAPPTCALVRLPDAPTDFPIWTFGTDEIIFDNCGAYTRVCVCFERQHRLIYYAVGFFRARSQDGCIFPSVHNNKNNKNTSKYAKKSQGLVSPSLVADRPVGSFSTDAV